MERFTLSPTNNNSIKSGFAPTVNGIVPAKITSFKDYFESKKLSSANPSVKEAKHGVEESGQESMHCKEQINSSSNM
jgi:hypothetical protein